MSAKLSVSVILSGQTDNSEDFNQNNLPDMLFDSTKSNINACNFYNILKLSSALSNSSHFNIYLNTVFYPSNLSLTT